MPKTPNRLPFLGCCLVVSLALRLTLGIGVVHGLSMWPALHPGDMVLFVRHLGPAEGSIVVADLPGYGLIIKRVAASGQGAGDPGRTFLLGDNRAQSYDSRAFGPLENRLIVGRVIAVWPGLAPRDHPPGRPSVPAPRLASEESPPPSGRTAWASRS